MFCSNIKVKFPVSGAKKRELHFFSEIPESDKCDCAQHFITLVHSRIMTIRKLNVMRVVLKG